MAKFVWHAIPTLETPRLILRAMVDSDADALLKIYGDPEVVRFAADPIFTDQSYIRKMLADVSRRFKIRDAIEWGIVLRQSATVVGTCGLHSFGETRASAEIGCMLAKRHWGNGLMHEALQSLIQLAACELQLSSLFADIDLLNVRSARLFARLGFHRCGATAYQLMLSQSGSIP